MTLVSKVRQIALTVRCEGHTASQAHSDVEAAVQAVTDFAKAQQAALDDKYPAPPPGPSGGCCGDNS